MVDGTRSESDAYAFPWKASSNFNLRLIPSSPAAMIPATARYGLTSPPGTRFSSRSDCPCPTSRNAQVRLSRPQRIAVGAKEPGTYLLYELILGANKSEISFKCAIWPAIKERPRSDKPCSLSESSAITMLPSRPRKEQWIWEELPSF